MNQEFANLEAMLLINELSTNDYFTLMISSSEDDLELSKNAIKSVLRKLKENYTKDKEEIFSSLKRLYDDFFHISTPEEEDKSNYCSDNDASVSMNTLSLESQPVILQSCPGEKTSKKRNRKKKGKNKSVCDKTSPVILWLRRDLRIYDNPALVTAAYNEAGEERSVIPVFIWNEEEEKERFTNGGAAKVWLRRALDELNKSLANQYRNRLVLRSCATSVEEELLSLVKETGSTNVVWTALYEPWILERDNKIQYRLNGLGVKVHIVHSYLLHRPNEVTVSNTDKGIGSVRHFMECCKNGLGSRAPIGTMINPPKHIKSPAIWPSSTALEDLKLYVKPRKTNGSFVDWAEHINRPGVWNFGENGGYDQLCRFLENDVEHYEKESSRADMPWTSVISPYLHWGELSPRTVLHEALARGKDATKFRRKLAW